MARHFPETVATIVWLLSGLFLYISSTAVTVLSLSAFLFIVIGMFAAAIVIGTPFGYAENLIVRATSRHLGARWARLAIIVAGVVLLVAEVLATFLVATWTFVQVNTVW
ncbi:MAG: hypothetical protein QF738_08900 [Rhodospirillales bacterium]|jgi:membrane-bound ClpP family serine protease|nr:hypothetical protein [Rhodospirillales bacterium]